MMKQLNHNYMPLAALTGVLFAGLGAGQVRAQDASKSDPKKSLWETSAAAGISLTRGNSETLTTTANLLSQKKWDKNEISLGIDGTYGENSGTKSSESIHGFGQYNRLFSDRAYGYGRVDALHDAVADVEYRVTLSPGVGYYLIKDETTRLSGEVGPGLVFEKQGVKESTYMTLRVAERFEHKFNDRVKIWQSIEWLPQVDKFSNWILNSEVGVEAQMTQQFALRVFAQDTYDNKPAPGRKSNDLKLVTALAYKF